MLSESSCSTTIANDLVEESHSSVNNLNINKWNLDGLGSKNFKLISDSKINLKPRKSGLETPNHTSDIHENNKKKNLETFESLGVPNWIIEICKSLQIKKPTKIQKLCLPSAFKGKNLIGCSETGTGKTICFCWPILTSLAKNPYGVYSLVLTPTRELAFQISDQFRIFGVNMNIVVLSCVGGVDIVSQSIEMEKRPHVIIATPGRLAYQVSNPERNLSSIFANVKYLVFDESDRLLDISFQEPLKEILKCIPKSSEGRITFMFSATITDSIRTLASKISNSTFEFYDATEESSKILKLNRKIEHEYVFLPQHVHITYLVYVLRERFLKDEKAKGIIFICTKKRCQLVSLTLDQLEFKVTCIHSLMKQSKRTDSLSKFRSGYSNLLVATDLVSRGIDVPEVSFVINLDFPGTAFDYIHRVGRTGRGGRQGIAFSFIDEFDVEKVKNVETSVDIKLKKYEIKDKEAVKLLNKVTVATQKAHLYLQEREYK
ncbi:DEAD/DEAH box helicase family protein [Theileria parva strain Muguga]|uniref:ATP-dependent RNA helicase, putative n=1 Tax=Theileria parva TaxID=5875 RepID=Q4N5F8_THEPA|nr:DEAD/DEAH box helicase family protein [Theileria parva strain Muguga]EAN32615.1 DEAD/DEAH box helicase family protein [Theileria parva strain Muguga]|eukprot:XP_764898.1 ATP-dependent RNA helicase [Theileria parva strain Muguga]